MAKISSYLKFIAFKYESSSLVEVTVAMIIIVLVFSLSLGIYIRVTAVSANTTKTKARLEAEDYLQRTLREKSFFNEIKNQENYTLEKQIQPYENNKDLLKLEIRFLDEKDSVLFAVKKIVYQP